MGDEAEIALRLFTEEGCFRAAFLFHFPVLPPPLAKPIMKITWFATITGANAPAKLIFMLS
jgi:hypothetical protein